MLRSLSSSISGLQNHQVKMDMIGNNIANVNTVGFKSQRMTFEESFSQMLAGSTRPSGGGGGTNPIQVGLGMAVGSVDTILSQGNVQSTGIVTDLAIEGNAYFEVSDGTSSFYSRSGGFQLNSEGYMTLPTNGMVLQGKIANQEGEFPAGTTVGDIYIPFNEQAPAQETTTVAFARNLNADSEAKGSVINTQVYLAQMTDGTAGSDDDELIAMKNSQGESLNLKASDKITLAVVGQADVQFTVVDEAPVPGNNEVQTLSQLVAEINTYLGANGAAAVVNGAIQITGAGAGLDKFQMTTDGPLAKSPFAQAMSFPANIAAGDVEATDTFLTAAKSTDLVANLLDSNGEELGLETGDVISVNANIGGTPITDQTTHTYDPAATSLQDVMDLISDNLSLPLYDGTTDLNPSVDMNAAGTDDNLPDGSIVIRGQAGTDFEIKGLSIRATNSNNAVPAPRVFDKNNSTTIFQAAKDTGVYDTSIQVYDKTGAVHDLTMTFVHTGVPNEWEWKASFPGTEEILKGGTGTLSFGQDGTVSSFNYDNNDSRLEIAAGGGAENIQIDLDLGGPGNFQGVTQFEAATTVSATSQDGYTTGALTDISIDSYGYISGVFTNGTTRSLAQITVVDFVNPGGLQKISDSVYSTSPNSGEPVRGTPGDQSTSKLRPGALESSNVEMAREFTEMITTQRGYQANSRVITVSDSMLEELMSLKR